MTRASRREPSIPRAAEGLWLVLDLALVGWAAWTVASVARALTIAGEGRAMIVDLNAGAALAGLTLPIVHVGVRLLIAAGRRPAARTIVAVMVAALVICAAAPLWARPAIVAWAGLTGHRICDRATGDRWSHPTAFAPPGVACPALPPRTGP
jgi:hypothetical protein